MTLIRSLLIANRGEIACRIARTARDLGIRTIAIHSDSDAGALHVAACDQAVALPGDAPADTYLRSDLIIAAARTSGADAIHPGYGFLAENSAFAQAVIDAGLIWIGPPPSAIAAMGSKVEAKAAMRAAGVPVLPDSSVEGIEQIGVPLLIKASAGGGGRGMRIVREASDLAESLEIATREAVSAFGDGTVFCERYVERSRHIEIQVMADHHGNTVALFERECSIQRRHQKIVEEAPSPAVTPELRARLCESAVTAARNVGYIGAGTVEFLMDPAGEFYFLEMNTRLQVEHPVTEMITGLDLVALQIRVAEGHPLPPEALNPKINGHSIEVRLTAEDPAQNYMPMTGTFHRFDITNTAGIRVDTGISSGSVISPHYDSMVAKVIAHGTDRPDAIRRLERALTTSKVHGPTTNLHQLRQILVDPRFMSGDIHTGFLEDDPCIAPMAATDLECVAVAVTMQAEHRSAASTWAFTPSGWRNNAAVAQSVKITDPEGLNGERELEVRYLLGRSPHIEIIETDPNGVAQTRQVPISHMEADPHGVTLQVGGMGTRIDVDLIHEQHRSVAYVHGEQGSKRLFVMPRFPAVDLAGMAGSLTAPMPGAIRRVYVNIGDQVSAGTPLLALEAMKMEHQVLAPADGIVAEVMIQVGDQVDTGQTLLRLEDAEDDQGATS
jgi:propionyl-CoA carboxylase alpha chain